MALDTLLMTWNNFLKDIFTCIWSHMTQLPEAHCLDASLDWGQWSGLASWYVCSPTLKLKGDTHKQEFVRLHTDLLLKVFCISECLKLTSHFQTQSSKQIWGELRCPPQTCSPEETTSQTWQRGWSWGWREWASTRRPSGSTRKRCDPLRRLQSDRF